MSQMRSLLLALVGAISLLGLPPAAAQSAPRVVNINTADAATLARELTGVGETRAAAIVAYRSKNGPFRSIEELTLVKGIGPRVIEQNRAILRVDPVRGGAVGVRNSTSGAAAATTGDARRPAASPAGR